MSADLDLVRRIRLAAASNLDTVRPQAFEQTIVIVCSLAAPGGTI